MNEMTAFLDVVKHQTIAVPVWQILTILAVAALCMLIRGTKVGLLFTYIFTLNIAFSFFKTYFSIVTLIIIGIFAAIILLIGMYEAFTE